WDLTNSPDLELPGTFEEFALPMVFCLTYLTPPEIESWVESLLQIDSPQWYLAIMTWWLKCYPTVLDDPLISQNNLTTFKAAATGCLSLEMFQRWAAHIQTFQMFQHHAESFPIGDDLYTSIQQTLQNFQKEFFGG
ncbi:MAG TPA: hypothetical protein VHP83_00875, partial [Aggregatilineaceae bacterium]|nr:hypothetical protein [Aggregatilineaceae bacterium]